MGIGVVLSALLYLNASSTAVRVVELANREDRAPIEREPPKQLPSEAVTVLGIYGSLFYAAARVVEEQLPSPRGARRPVVVLRLRDHGELGATMVQVLQRYAAQLQEAGGRLYLSGVSEARSPGRPVTLRDPGDVGNARPAEVLRVHQLLPSRQPAPEEERSLMDLFRTVGVGPGSELPTEPELRAAIVQGTADVQALINARISEGPFRNGWRVPDRTSAGQSRSSSAGRLPPLARHGFWSVRGISTAPGREEQRLADTLDDRGCAF